MAWHVTALQTKGELERELAEMEREDVQRRQRGIAGSKARVVQPQVRQMVTAARQQRLEHAFETVFLEATGAKTAAGWLKMMGMQSTMAAALLRRSAPAGSSGPVPRRKRRTTRTGAPVDCPTVPQSGTPQLLLLLLATSQCRDRTRRRCTASGHLHRHSAAWIGTPSTARRWLEGWCSFGFAEHAQESDDLELSQRWDSPPPATAANIDAEARDMQEIAPARCTIDPEPIKKCEPVSAAPSAPAEAELGDAAPLVEQQTDVPAVPALWADHLRGEDLEEALRHLWFADHATEPCAAPARAAASVDAASAWPETDTLQQHALYATPIVSAADTPARDESAPTAPPADRSAAANLLASASNSRRQVQFRETPIRHVFDVPTPEHSPTEAAPPSFVPDRSLLADAALPSALDALRRDNALYVGHPRISRSAVNTRQVRPTIAGLYR